MGEIDGAVRELRRRLHTTCSHRQAHVPLCVHVKRRHRDGERKRLAQGRAQNSC